MTIRKSAIARTLITALGKLADRTAVTLDRTATRLLWAGRPEGVE